MLDTEKPEAEAIEPSRRTRASSSRTATLPSQPPAKKRRKVVTGSDVLVKPPTTLAATTDSAPVKDGSTHGNGTTIGESKELTEVPKPKPRKKAKEPPVEPVLEDFKPRVQNEWKIGAHVSAAGGVENAVKNAASIGCVDHSRVSSLSSCF